MSRLDKYSLSRAQRMGKTTLLNVLAHRTGSSRISVDGHVMANDRAVSQTSLRQFSSYVEQEDALIGSLTVKESISFAARLAIASNTTATDRCRRVNYLIESFGLQKQADQSLLLH